MNKPNVCRFALLSTCLLGLLSPGLATAHPITITEDNSSFVLSHTDPSIVGSLPFTGVWSVDGRDILTYVSSPANLFDIGAHHPADSHVAANQLHAAGTLLGDPNISGGIVYTLDGGAADSGISRLVEMIELTLGPGITTPQLFHLSGFGFEPLPHGGVTFEIPDLTGLSITGTTLAFATQGSFSVGPFRGLTILPFHAFTGFNTFSEDISLDPGSTLRMITELNVARTSTVPEPSSWLLVAAGLACLALVARRRPGSGRDSEPTTG
jgi:hypothetical protein